MGGALVGILILVIAGVTNGGFTLPMKFTRQWEWENTWLVYTVWALFVLPVLVTLATVPGLRGVYAGTPGAGALVAMVAACGAGWGISQIFFGLAVEGVGIALAFSVILGLSAAVGSLVPLLRQHPDQIFQPLGLQALGGVALVLVGVGICAVAGRRREAALRLSRAPAAVQAQASAASGGEAAAMALEAPAAKVSVGRGLLYCTISGIGSALVNIGFTEGKPLQDFAQAHGVAAAWAPNAIWLPLMLAGGVPGLLYCAYLVGRNRTRARFTRPGTAAYFGLAGVMALCWFGSTLLYGIGAGDLGSLGTVLGWPVFMSLIVITASVLGLLTGEWKGSGTRPLRIMCGGVGVLILAIVVLSHAG